MINDGISNQNYVPSLKFIEYTAIVVETNFHYRDFHHQQQVRSTFIKENTASDRSLTHIFISLTHTIRYLTHTVKSLHTPSNPLHTHPKTPYIQTPYTHILKPLTHPQTPYTHPPTPYTHPSTPYTPSDPLHMLSYP